MGGKYKRAQTLMVVMAQPIACNATAFRIVMYSSDGSFTAEDVKHRLETVHIKNTTIKNKILSKRLLMHLTEMQGKFERLSSHLGWTFHQLVFKEIFVAFGHLRHNYSTLKRKKAVL
jgi:hypothetical protein